MGNLPINTHLSAGEAVFKLAMLFWRFWRDRMRPIRCQMHGAALWWQFDRLKETAIRPSPCEEPGGKPAADIIDYIENYIGTNIGKTTFESPIPLAEKRKPTNQVRIEDEIFFLLLFL